MARKIDFGQSVAVSVYYSTLLLSLLLRTADLASVRTQLKQLPAISAANNVQTNTTSTPNATSIRDTAPEETHFRYLQPEEDTRECPIGQYLRNLHNGRQVCTPCTSCPPGFGVERRCGLWSDTQCIRCLEGQEYRRVYFGVNKCLRCTNCANRPVVQECTESEDRVCGRGCNPGYFLDDLTNECIRCSYCYPEVPGYGVPEPMCQTQHQPVEMTCLPSLPPKRFREQQTPPRQQLSGSLEQKVMFLDEKIQTLDRLFSTKIGEMRQYLSTLINE